MVPQTGLDVGGNHVLHCTEDVGDFFRRALHVLDGVFADQPVANKRVESVDTAQILILQAGKGHVALVHE